MRKELAVYLVRIKQGRKLGADGHAVGVFNVRFEDLAYFIDADVDPSDCEYAILDDGASIFLDAQEWVQVPDLEQEELHWHDLATATTKAKGN
jgi:hypothetical protein